MRPDDHPSGHDWKKEFDVMGWVVVDGQVDGHDGAAAAALVW